MLEILQLNGKAAIGGNREPDIFFIDSLCRDIGFNELRLIPYRLLGFHSKLRLILQDNRLQSRRLSVRNLPLVEFIERLIIAIRETKWKKILVLLQNWLQILCSILVFLYYIILIVFNREQRLQGSPTVQSLQNMTRLNSRRNPELSIEVVGIVVQHRIICHSSVIIQQERAVVGGVISVYSFKFLRACSCYVRSQTITDNGIGIT